MLQASDDFDKLVQALVAYCKMLREQSGVQEVAHKLKQVFKKVLPTLAETFDDDDPDLVYANRIVSFGVEGIGNEAITTLWEEYFILGTSAKDVAGMTRYSPGSVYRHARNFPQRVAIQLWEKNKELAAPPEKRQVPPITVEQRRKKILQEAFGLTDRQSEVFLLFAHTFYSEVHLSRKQIAQMLFMSPNTLKAHIRKIIRKVNEKTMNEAAVRAIDILQNHPDAEWKEPSKKPEAISIFFAYAHEDEGLRDELEKHLSILKRQGLMASWHDRKIGPGKEWDGEIDEHINKTKLILLLISPDFIASDYCWDVEMKRAMERHEAGEARVIPIILRPTDWKGAPFEKLQALPKDAKAVTLWPNQDEVLLNIAQGIRKALEELTA